MTTVLSADWVLPVEAPPIRDGAVAIQDGRIAAVGTKDELGKGQEYAEAAIIPGFVNAHSHLEYAVYAGFGDGLDFSPWILVHIERKARLGWEDQLEVARLGAADCLGSGITTVGDASFSGAAAVACDELGLRGIVCLEVFGRTPDEALARFEANRARVQGGFSERVRLGVSPHTPVNISDEIYAACVGLGLPVATHFSESAAELEWLTKGTGPVAAFAERGLNVTEPCGTSGIRRLADAGVLGPRITAAHCVHLSAGDVELLARHDVGVVHCPRSNALLGCGIAPLSGLRGAGIRVGLGTDSPASTPSFDMFEEMRTAIYMARARAGSAEALSGAEALELATLGSARALGMADEIGTLASGKRADLTVVSLQGSPYLPWEDPAAAVVFGGSPGCVAATVVDGEVRYNKGDFEWHALRRRAANARGRMLDADQAAVAALPSL